MASKFAIDYIDDNTYSMGMFSDGVLNGWGCKVYTKDGIDTIERGYYKNGLLDGGGIIYRFLEEGPEEIASLFKEGKLLSLEEIKKLFPYHKYNFRPHYNGDVDFRETDYYGAMGEDGYPRGFGYVIDEGQVFVIHCDEEGYRAGLFFYSNEDGSFGEYIYGMNRTELSKMEWAFLMHAGVGLNIKKLVKKYRLVK